MTIFSTENGDGVKLERVLEDLWRKSRFASFFYQGVDTTEIPDLPTLALAVYSSRLTLFFNKNFIETLSEDELTGLLVHEMLHMVLNHNHRASPDGSVYLQNLAQDMIINSYITENKKTFFSRKSRYISETPELLLPPGLPVIPDIFFEETANTDPVWEEVYLWLKKRSEEEVKEFSFTEKKETKSGFDSGLKGGVEELQDALNSLDLTYNTAPKEKYTSFKNMAGLKFEKTNGDSVPTGIHIMNRPTDRNIIDSKINHFINFASRDELCREERIFGEINSLINAPKKTDTTWKDKLKSIVDITSQSNEWEYTWHRFNKRYFSKGIYAPGRSFKDKEAITVVVDVSGSMVMQPGDLESAFGIIEDLLSRFKLYLLCIDEKVFVPKKNEDRFVKSTETTKPYEYKKGDWRYIRTGSSGTTYFASLFNAYMDNHNELLIIITDGYIYDVEKLKTYKNTLWLISENREETFNPPFGKAVKIETRKQGRLKIRRD